MNITVLLNYCQIIDISEKLENIFMIKSVKISAHIDCNLYTERERERERESARERVNMY